MSVSASAANAPALTWTAVTEDDTARLAQQLAQAMGAQPALADALLTLRGNLGAGKTTFVRHLLRALGVTGRIKSPTYALVEPYELPATAARAGAPLPAWHADLYRFDDPREWEDAGLRELFATPGLKLVEWPEKAATLLPMADLDLHFLHDGDDARRIVVAAPTARGAQLLAALA
ncbi:tRNA (adenosine(37)-N6)-threonylcarbamoyltransferase complex ATPase subunit type 1 TsaE [Tepidimonas taiwanensis]|uniref:tRNA threonylcarbamoyladenosine biosynthesis protein TsaE n=1 Tax=Tepidimonas taiwanensis TaxID=307486 RepID=A0A554X6R4_9BURK|nr:tRNA (adenosine(37)-N6)-threonylcarbamoyltransferase complex ATPase subunit type 1 TsaE [Tepidimonas taiwanensis]MCX7692352.1 tRNA (adenosine(37)-N6)-threonylcarbamoyltransferase complex ATPase subunit type 1 TsaE [Tepidimonas taiwanensis]MDM7462142.1 tRNA (adenosine(37)-N6)-threonylcarbamoyltransferase complex ATPase subunit type 1 TsaE [Tepidimonas taiwanensis]TSE31530.1 tRNA threonylcarbamoyladenosine biosynthesis protein TsaE [Tepidimonas taiwanensis]UBQ06228.1 tRNA (adenosine(37)-N6)-th